MLAFVWPVRIVMGVAVHSVRLFFHHRGMKPVVSPCGATSIRYEPAARLEIEYARDSSVVVTSEYIFPSVVLTVICAFCAGASAPLAALPCTVPESVPPAGSLASIPETARPAVTDTGVAAEGDAAFCPHSRARESPDGAWKLTV